MESSPHNGYHMSQAEVAEKLFLHKNTVGEIEERALAKLRVILERRGLTYQDLAID